MEFSDKKAETARNSHRLFLQALQVDEVKETEIASRMKVSASTVNRLKNEHSENFCHLLSEVGLKIVPDDAFVADIERVQALLLLCSNSFSVENLLNTLKGD